MHKQIFESLRAPVRRGVQGLLSYGLAESMATLAVLPMCLLLLDLFVHREATETFLVFLGGCVATAAIHRSLSLAILNHLEAAADAPPGQRRARPRFFLPFMGAALEVCAFGLIEMQQEFALGALVSLLGLIFLLAWISPSTVRWLSADSFVASGGSDSSYYPRAVRGGHAWSSESSSDGPSDDCGSSDGTCD